MALFVGGPADGWWLEVEPDIKELTVALTPKESSDIYPAFTYKQECISINEEEYCVFIPEDWNSDQLIQALILYYRKENKLTGRDYINNTQGTIYDNDDRKVGELRYAS